MGAFVAGRHIELVNAAPHTMLQQKHSKLVLATVRDYRPLDFQLQGEAGNNGPSLVFWLGCGQQKPVVIVPIGPCQAHRTELGLGQNLKGL